MSISVFLQFNNLRIPLPALGLLYIFFSVIGAVVMWDEYGESMSVTDTEAGNDRAEVGWLGIATTDQLEKMYYM